MTFELAVTTRRQRGDGETSVVRKNPNRCVCKERLFLNRATRPQDQRVTSAVKLDSIESISTGTLTSRLGRLSDARMRETCAATQVAMGCD